jgi:hypothetical protein
MLPSSLPVLPVPLLYLARSCIPAGSEHGYTIAIYIRGINIDSTWGFFDF